ncbi:MAG: dihydrolipoamide acetyltransferase family protein [Verrucomicrobiota bacterium]|nr:dihydrolipoamide acetyltransferase family protein [Verrucomicrobiota bacterium]
MAIEFKLPELGENIEGGDVVNVLVSEGDSIAEGQSIIEIEAGKASMEIPSPVEGSIEKLLISQGDTISVGQHIITFSSDNTSKEEPPAAKEEPPAAKEEPPVQKNIEKPISAAPNVRRLARELGVDIKNVHSSSGGRISLDDVKEFARKNGSLENVPKSKPLDRKPVVVSGKQGKIRIEKMNKVRIATMNHMSYCWNTIPHVTQHDTVDISRLNDLRKNLGSRAEERGAKLTVTAMLVKIISSALKVFPNFNASINSETNEIQFKEFYNIGIAVDTEQGLIVPVIKDADHMSMIDLAVELTAISQKARAGQISLKELQGGTFTISNIGGIGGSFFTPIVNSPEVAILGIGRAVIDASGKMMMPLSLSYDHRLIDGADGARFLKWIIDAINEPMTLYIDS